MLLSKLVILDQVDSTNNYTANLIKTDDIRHGTVILSYNQQNGRGQRGTPWNSEPYKNIAFSIYLKHIYAILSNQHFLSCAVALAVKDLLQENGITAKIKWPNDLLVEDKKISGILIENQLSGKDWISSIVGIGMNVNQSFTSETDFAATSMTKLLNKELDLEALSYQLIEKIERRYDQFRKGEYAVLSKEYADNMWRIGEWTEAEISGERKDVRIHGTDENGLLLLEAGDSLSSFDIKEVKFFY